MHSISPLPTSLASPSATDFARPWATLLILPSDGGEASAWAHAALDVAKALRHHIPDGRVDVLTDAAGASVLAELNTVDSHGGRSWFAAVFHHFDADALYARGYAAALDFSGSLRGPVAAWRSGARLRVAVVGAGQSVWPSFLLRPLLSRRILLSGPAMPHGSPPSQWVEALAAWGMDPLPLELPAASAPERP